MKRSREEILFELALGRSGAERVTFLNDACRGDSELRKLVDSLLADHDRKSEQPFPDKTAKVAPGPLNESPLTEGPGSVIGRYKLLEKIGEGGFGSVWAAEQREPVRRRVALKIIKLGMDTKQVVARFEAERQALALMDHPNIAKVLDAGATDSGRPFFVMELVKGISITEYCDREKVPTGDRLGLFINVCNAIQHAHQKGIIHRDIKPSNILVTFHDGVPVPKVIDFGIAKATQQELTEKTIYTQFNQFIGTPAYMSPEQAEMSGLDIDTRSDIYSLGVLLYELLTGTTPFDTKELIQSGIDELRRIIREREPVRPSTRLSQALSSGRPASRRLRRRAMLPADLDWIVMKCLEKDRTRRYDTANGLAMDLQRHRNNEPIVARPPSAAYRLQKAWRRNKVVYSSGLAVATVLVLGIAISVWQAAIATRAKNQADEARAEALQQRDESRRLLYAADMKLAQLGLSRNNIGRAALLLDRHRPSPEDPEPTFEWRYLWQQTQIEGQIAVLHFRDSSVVSLAFSPDDRWLVIGDGEGLIVVDAETHQKRHTIPTATLPQEIHFSDDGKYLLTGGQDEVVLWSPRTWEPLQRYPGSTRPAALSPDAKTIICNGSRGIQVRDAQTGDVLHELDGLRSGEIWGGIARTVGFSADGTQVVALVTSGPQPEDMEIRVWKVAELRSQGAEAKYARVGGSWLSSLKELSLDRQGKLLAGCSVLGSITLWDLTTGEQRDRLELGATRALGRLVFSRKDDILLGSSWDQTVRGWRLGESEGLVECWRLRGHREAVHTVADSHDGSMIASGDRSGTVILWHNPSNAETEPPHSSSTSVVADRLNHLQFLSDHRTLVAQEFWTDSLSFWDVGSVREEQRFEGMPWHSGARVSPDERWVAIAREEGWVDLMDIATREVVTTLRGHTHEVRRIFFSPDSRQLFTATVAQLDASGGEYGTDNVVRHWEIPSGRLIREHRFSVHLNGLSVSPGGDKYAVQLGDGTAEVGRLPSFERIWSTPEERSPHRVVIQLPVVFSPDGTKLAIGSAAGTSVQVHDATSGSLLFTTGVLDTYPLGTDFTPDSRSLAVGIRSSVKFWDVATGQETLELQQPGSVYEMTFSGDGRILAVGTYLIAEVDSDLDAPVYKGRRTQLGVQLIRAPAWQEILATEAQRREP